jgi:hypothetical protein
MPRGRVWIVLLVLLAAAGGAWYFFRAEVETAVGRVEKALESGPTITPIRDIVAAPSRFAGKEVTVRGAVTSTSEVVTSGGWTSRFYTLKGEGAEIVVLVREVLPAATASRSPASWRKRRPRARGSRRGWTRGGASKAPAAEPAQAPSTSSSRVGKIRRSRAVANTRTHRICATLSAAAIVIEEGE